MTVTERSNSATLTGSSPIVRRAESPRPMPMIIRPPEMSWSVANALAVTVGSRVPGLVTFSPSLIVDVASAEGLWLALIDSQTNERLGTHVIAPRATR